MGEIATHAGKLIELMVPGEAIELTVTTPAKIIAANVKATTETLYIVKPATKIFFNAVNKN